MTVQGSALLDRFEAERPRLRAQACRMLGSRAEADDAVQEVWLRFDRTDMSEVKNVAAWLTTVLSRVCLNLLRARQARREQSLDGHTADWLTAVDENRIPQEEVEWAESVGLAMLVVLDRLTPAERIAFVLHDMFDVAFSDIAHSMRRSVAAVRQLASRARVKVRGGQVRTADRDRRRAAVEAYLTATRVGDFAALLTLLDPEIELRADATVTGTGKPLTLHGALAVAKSAAAATPRARHTALALVDGSPALVMAPLGQLSLVIQFGFLGPAITTVRITADRDRLRTFTIALAG
ncbi:sigma-70 family RNA polymerase sigma factor [Micromonospora palythoicola]|uniref:sigma-70 family RNA polymerase sigma factor n=1 Tax=Micromonospora palythoicola TaxID=3120507 RepID=UPI002FCE00E5